MADALPSADLPTDDRLAEALGECARCLPAALAAGRSGQGVRCDRCGAMWVIDPDAHAHVEAHARRVQRVDVPADLEALARWLPTIVGRALSPSEPGFGGPRLDGRSDQVDAHHRDARLGLRRALAALTVLDQLEAAGQRRHVHVLWYGYVLTGPELARVHKGGREDLVARTFASRDQLAFWASHKSRKVRDLQIGSYGARLLDGARAAYEGTVRGLRLSPPDERTTDHAGLAHDLDVLLRRTLERSRQRVASESPANGPESPANEVAKRKSPA